jgi:putative transposase
MRFTLSLHDIEELLTQCDINASYEIIRRWCLKFGPEYARRQRPIHGERRYLDKAFMSIGGQRYYLWRAVGQDDNVIDILPAKRRGR